MHALPTNLNYEIPQSPEDVISMQTDFENVVTESIMQSRRFDPTPLITQRFDLDKIVEAYDLFSPRRDGVLKVAIRP